ncbi:hypothetical protein ABT346_30800, partial [Micromonospora peucetia]|uniref:hypothetical protein n=1 Tax=Micromonospora peucetia TaxID=47871 RepID=UPI00332FB4CF
MSDHAASRRATLRRAAAVVFAATCVAGVLAGPSSASAEPSTGPGGGQPASGTADPIATSYKITLVTGQTIILETFASGRQNATIEPGPNGLTASIRTMQVDGDLYVIPDEANAYLANDRLDRELFNVSK